MEWVEAVGKTVEEAVNAAMRALEQTSREAVDIEVIDEGKKSILGLGGREAKVKVTVKPQKKRRRRGKVRDGKPDRVDKDNKSDRTGDGNKRRPRPGDRNEPRNKSSNRQENRQEKGAPKKVAVDTKPDRNANIEEQADVAREFAEGLLKAFGLEGTVNTRVEDDVLYIDIEGEQTEALVGRKGAVVQAVHELTRTVIQRKTFGAPRIRLDIAGYAARRREALKIYAGRLAETVIEDGREAMLEAMNAADRKVVHDAIAEIDGVRSYSEGEEPNRSVVVAPDD
ncbi:MAG: RNA-binding cell elongation regulator Jag/EloR [Acidimicrobiia bacterium]